MNIRESAFLFIVIIMVKRYDFNENFLLKL